MLWFTEPAFTSYGPKETAEKLIKSWNWSSKDATTKMPETRWINIRPDLHNLQARRKVERYIIVEIDFQKLYIYIYYIYYIYIYIYIYMGLSLHFTSR